MRLNWRAQQPSEEVGGLELQMELDEENIMKERGKVEEDVEARSSVVLKILQVWQCLSKDALLASYMRHLSSPVPFFAFFRSRRGREVERWTRSGCFNVRDHSTGVQDANLAEGQSGYVTVDICAPSLPHSASFKQGELEDAQFWSWQTVLRSSDSSLTTTRVPKSLTMTPTWPRISSKILRPGPNLPST
ncbi:hypothetical protein BDN72DRAFT_405807 [Pluteus cervinus]|uniref:Uncharacterized protein n=1 Tax=Pluteus cervinus TaxID=181527 RepID=A0ACD3A908_9AGAR|nr:hypothetical protein BDN72DRAFT_405807 [Pluteus cervinus]